MRRQRHYILRIHYLDGRQPEYIRLVATSYKRAKIMVAQHIYNRKSIQEWTLYITDVVDVWNHTM
jgi:hypothetical protein